jgi:hypothetical protein
MSADTVARHRAIATVLTSIGQVATLLAAGLLGVLIAHQFGSDARTDGFFTANSIYGIALFVATSLRATAVPRLVAGAGDDTELSRHMRAIGLMAAAAAGLFAVLGVAIIPAVTSSLPAAAEHTARLSLALLWPACALQLFCGLAAAKLAVLDDYRAAALAYAAGACSNVIAFVILTPIFAVEGVPLALVTGAAVTSVILALELVRRRVRIIPRWVPGAARTAGRLMLGAAALISAQIVLVLSVAFAAHTGVGEATLYSYAMMAIMVLTAALVSPITIVFAPVVAREGERRAETLAPLSIRAIRASGLVTPVALAGLILLGRGPAGVVLTKLSSRELNELFRLVLVLSPSLIAAQLMMIPLLGVLSEGRLTALAVWSLSIAAVHAGLTAAAVTLGGGVEAVAAVAVVSSFALASITNLLAFGPQTPAVARRAIEALAAFVAPGALAFVIAAMTVGGGRSLGRGLLAWALGTALYGVWLRWRHGAEIGELVGVLRGRTAAA